MNACLDVRAIQINFADDEMCIDLPEGATLSGDNNMLRYMDECKYYTFAPDKLYHSYIVFGKNEIKIGALIKGEPVYVRVDTFNEVGITEGEVIEVNTVGN